MSTEITLYHRTIHGGELVMREAWLLERRVGDPYREHIDAVVVRLPDRYRVARSNGGPLALYDALAGDVPCGLRTHPSGRPQIEDADGLGPVLEVVQ